MANETEAKDTGMPDDEKNRRSSNCSPCSSVESSERRRDIALDAIMFRLATMRDPQLSTAEFQRRGTVLAWDGGWTALLDDKPLAYVHLEGPTQFRVVVC